MLPRSRNIGPSVTRLGIDTVALGGTRGGPPLQGYGLTDDNAMAVDSSSTVRARSIASQVRSHIDRSVHFQMWISPANTRISSLSLSLSLSLSPFSFFHFFFCVCIKKHEMISIV